jgi:hypothetical protein
MIYHILILLDSFFLLPDSNFHHQLPPHGFLHLGNAPDLAGGGEDRLHPRFRDVVPEFVGIEMVKWEDYV